MSIEIDGSILEGGGQILRNTISLCCLTNSNVQINNIRGKRSKPGLRPQHLHGLQLVGRLCNGKITGDKVESTSICFKPGRITGGKYEADTKTAGSTSLLMQIAVPCLCFADSVSSLTVKGGTDADMAPPIDYYADVFLPVAKRFGVDINCNLIRRGFYPQGKGEVQVDVNPVKELLPVDLTEFGEIKTISGKCFIAGNLLMKVAHKMATAATSYIKETLGIIADIQTFRETDQKAFGTGCGIIITSETTTGCIFGGSAVGKRGKPAEEVGTEAAKSLCEDLQQQVCVDRYSQDQLIIFMALANGTSKVKVGPITLHTQTAINIAERITKASFSIEKVGDNNEDINIITCNGIAYKTK